MSATVRVELDGDVAVVVIDNPPINAGSRDVRAGLLAWIRAACDDPAVRAVVIIGAGTTFIAGADLREFGQPLEDPQLPQVIAAIEACPKPVVAALHGAALGGGFELALGCDARVALAGTVVGLPEVTLGIIPGAGGTQRMARLVGVPKAIAMICSGERVEAGRARDLGLVDHVVDADLRSAAVEWARALSGKARVRELSTPESDQAAISLAAANALRAGKNRPAVRAAIDAVLAARDLPIDQALAQERAAFQELRTTREARALRHQFFAEREAARYPGLDGAAALTLKKIAVIGAGTMGTGIAIALLDAGFEVALLERDEAPLRAGVERIHRHYHDRVAANKIGAIPARERQDRLRSGIDWWLVSDADLIIEAIFEDLEIKKELFRMIDKVARPGAVLASNTSYIDLDAIAAATARPEDVVGLHFFSPAHVMRLLEIVRGAHTAPEVLATSLQLAKRLRKVPVVAGNAFGFIGNRIYAAYRRQCEFMLEEGASPQDVDSALEHFGFAMGPFAVGDMSGLDIAWRMRQGQAASRDPAARYVDIPDRLCEAGRLGRKTGAGYYLYGQPGQGRMADPLVGSIIDGARSAKQIVPRALGEDEIVRRALLAMVNEAALLLQEGVAQRGSDIDVVMVNGYGFPKWEGGPVFWARERGLADLDIDTGWLAQASGTGFIRADLHQLFSSTTSESA